MYVNIPIKNVDVMLCTCNVFKLCMIIIGHLDITVIYDYNDLHNNHITLRKLVLFYFKQNGVCYFYCLFIVLLLYFKF